MSTPNSNMVAVSASSQPLSASGPPSGQPQDSQAAQQPGSSRTQPSSPFVSNPRAPAPSIGRGQLRDRVRNGNSATSSTGHRSSGIRGSQALPRQHYEDQFSQSANNHNNTRNDQHGGNFANTASQPVFGFSENPVHNDNYPVFPFIPKLPFPQPVAGFLGAA